ncbi:unnamed protein product [Brassica rapa subsp. narinosa]
MFIKLNSEFSLFLSHLCKLAISLLIHLLCMRRKNSRTISGFVAPEICIRNTVGPKKGQAVALRVRSDRAVFYRCHIDAYQDTFYAHKYQQFYRKCHITGSPSDFICGHATAVFQNCQIEARRPFVGQSNRGHGVFLPKIQHNLHFVKATIKTFFGRIILLPSLSISPPPLFHGF